MDLRLPVSADLDRDEPVRSCAVTESAATHPPAIRYARRRYSAGVGAATIERFARKREDRLEQQRRALSEL